MRAIELLIIRAAADDHLLFLGRLMAAELILSNFTYNFIVPSIGAKNVATTLKC